MSEFDNWKEEFGVNDSKYSIEHYLMEQAFKAGQQSQQANIDLLEKELTETQAFLNKQNHIKQSKIDELQTRIDVYELHIKTLKNIHENDFNEESESSYILGNLDGFFECIEADLKGNKDEK